MASKIKNIILFTIIAAILILVYIFFIKKAPDEQNLVSSSSSTLPNADVLNNNSSITKDFLSVLLSVKSIKLDNAIFSDGAFSNLHDSSILLTPTGDEGRANPFAPIGQDPVVIPPPAPVVTSMPVVITPPTCVLPQVLDVPTNVCITPTPKIECTLPKVLNTTTNTCVTPVKCKLPKVLDESTNTCVAPQKTP